MGQPAVTSIPFAFGDKRPRPYIVSPAIAERPTHDFSHILRRRAASVQHFEVFSDLPMADCSALMAAAQERQFGRRHTVFLEGDPVRQVVLLVSGSLKVTQLGANGRRSHPASHRSGRRSRPSGKGRKLRAFLNRSDAAAVIGLGLGDEPFRSFLGPATRFFGVT